VEPEAREVLLHLHGRRPGHDCHRCGARSTISALVNLLLGRSVALLCSGLLAALEHDR
jgi:hypothetical protein